MPSDRGLRLLQVGGGLLAAGSIAILAYVDWPAEEAAADHLVQLEETPSPRVASKGAAADDAPIEPNSEDGTVIAISAPPADLHRELLSETRDAAWAGRSEYAIRDAMRGFTFLGQGSPLDVQCQATLCEVRGSISAPSIDARKLRWQEIEAFMQGDALYPAGVVPAAAVFGTRADAYAFVLQFRRDDAVLAVTGK